ncbi:MAG: peptide ligase PGM1-related protein [Actinomycetota bacterium]|nr:peptide ligase PGM1-related protein [Actinomycetota bacterium]
MPADIPHGSAPADDFERATRGRGIVDVGLLGLTEGCIVVLPSITFPATELRKITGLVRYEERSLFTLLLLRNPGVRVIYVTALPIDAAVVDYYLSFLDDPDGARERLTLIDLGDPEVRALSAKLLERPEVVERISRAIAGDDACLVPFNVTPLEADLAELLGIPLYGPRPDLIRWGSKSGGRRIARRAGVPILEGAEDLHELEDVEEVIEQLRLSLPEAEAVVVKLNNGFSGQGNVVVELAAPVAPIARSKSSFCATEETWPSFALKLKDEGGIVEELKRSDGLVSPSVQLRISATGSIEVVSSHDQVLGGLDNQVYLGCQFPARAEYRQTIHELAARVGGELAAEGVIGVFGIDFIVILEGESRAIYLSEINLRMGGTTHPYFMANLALRGNYEAATGELMSGTAPKTYFATDNLKSDAYEGLCPNDVIASVADAGLAFSPDTGTGVLLHLLGALHDFGKVGATCMANTDRDSAELYDAFVACLDRMAASRS